MQSENKYQFVVLGLGSIGKRHAEFLSSYNGDLICIDPNKLTFKLYILLLYFISRN